MDTRRDFLKKTLLLSGAAGLSGMMPASIQRALAIDPETGSTYLDAEHVVILMQENRSFDHCFGTLRGVRGFNDPRAITLPDGNLVWMQTNREGETYAPFRFNLKDTKATWMGSTPHSRSSQVDANNQGRYDQWLNAKQNKNYPGVPLTMGYYNREDLPFNYALADAFTVCDQHFCSAMTSTWPNRLYMWSGTIRADQSGDAKAYIRNDIPYGEAHWKTFPERLEENGISWKVYQNDITTGGGFSGEERSWLANFGCNQLEFLSQYQARFSPRYVKSLEDLAGSLPEEIAGLEKKIGAMASSDKGREKALKDLAKKKEVLEQTRRELRKWTRENFAKLPPETQSLYRKAFTTNEGDPDYHRLTTLSYEEEGVRRELTVPKGDILYQFRKDAGNGDLPTVSWLVPPQNFSDHPSAPWYGAWFMSEVLDILTRDPELWKKTIFILTYDENDGYFDHVPPFTAPDPEAPQTGKCSEGLYAGGAEYVRREQEIREGVHEKEAREGPIGLGYRVPMIIASPWSRGGKVCSQVFDHTSSLQFLEKFLEGKFGRKIVQENISPWRRAVCGDLTAAFSTYKGEKTEQLPFLPRDPFIESIYSARFKEEPSTYRKLGPEDIETANHRPASSSFLPRQEPGTRPSCPLPYQLYAEGRLSADRKSFEIVMEAGNEVFGERSAGSPFKVYAPGRYRSLAAEKRGGGEMEAVRAWDYAVSAGEKLSDSWPLNAFEKGNYHLRVYGPNGFFREFGGSAGDPPLRIECDYQRNPRKKGLSGNIELRISNADPDRAYTLLVKDEAYGGGEMRREVPASGRETLSLELGKSHGWYDFSISILSGAGLAKGAGPVGQAGFSRRYAGRVETGKTGISDPAMA